MRCCRQLVDWARGPRLTIALTALLCLGSAAGQAATNTQTFVVASYNVRNWLSMDRWEQRNRPKPLKEKEAVVGIVTQIAPDLIGFQEIGSTKDLADIQSRLQNAGVALPYREWIQGGDTNRHVALLSRFPITRRQSRGGEPYRLGARTFDMSRGILDVTLTINEAYSLRAVVVHLKSRRPVADADEALMRLEEARLLRRHVGKILTEDPAANVLVMGDMNDEPESTPVRLVLGEPPFHLLDLLPRDGAGLSWTHYWVTQEQKSRIDYLLASPGLYPEYVTGSARVADFDGWHTGSDHRAVFATFRAEDQPPAAPQSPVAVPLPVESTGFSPDARLMMGAAVGLLLLVGAVVVLRVLRRPHRASGASSADAGPHRR